MKQMNTKQIARVGNEINNVRRLNDLMLKKIGYAYAYMNHWHPEIWGENPKPLPKKHPRFGQRPDGGQRTRVLKLIDNFCKERDKNWENPKWFKEQIYLLDDETENMC